MAASPRERRPCACRAPSRRFCRLTSARSANSLPVRRSTKSARRPQQPHDGQQDEEQQQKAGSFQVARCHVGCAPREANQRDKHPPTRSAQPIIRFLIHSIPSLVRCRCQSARRGLRRQRQAAPPPATGCRHPLRGFYGYGFALCASAPLRLCVTPFVLRSPKAATAATAATAPTTAAEAPAAPTAGGGGRARQGGGGRWKAWWTDYRSSPGGRAPCCCWPSATHRPCPRRSASPTPRPAPHRCHALPAQRVVSDRGGEAVGGIPHGDGRIHAGKLLDVALVQPKRHGVGKVLIPNLRFSSNSP